MNYKLWKQQLSKPEILALLSEGTIVTPFELIEEIVDKLPVQWDNPNLKFLDPVCGRGSFLFVIKNRLMQYHSEQHIVENMLYGIDISQQNVAFAKAVLNTENKYKDNIECSNSLEKEWNMKFDVVVGNPPYQDDTSVNTKNLWPKFVEKAIELTVSNGYISMITPRTWTTNEMYDSVFRKIQPIVLNVDHCAKYFPGIGSTFSYFVIKNTPYDYSKKVKITLADGHEFLSILPKTGLGMTSSLALSIMQKTNTNHYFKVITSSGYNTMKFSKKDKSVSRTQDNEHPYPVLHKKLKDKGEIYFYSSHLDKTIYNIPRVIVGLWVANYKDMWVSSTLLTCEQFRHFPVNTLAEAYILKDVLQSKLYTFIAKTSVSGGSFTTKSLSYFPKVDLSRSWTDEELYAHFNLTKEEIDLIESTIK